MPQGYPGRARSGLASFGFNNEFHCLRAAIGAVRKAENLPADALVHVSIQRRESANYRRKSARRVGNVGAVDYTQRTVPFAELLRKPALPIAGRRAERDDAGTAGNDSIAQAVSIDNRRRVTRRVH